jgi:hypothetical protein
MSEITQIYIISILQVLIALGLVNVWLVRFNKSTKYRGKGAGNMKDEFSAYGLPAWSMYVVGFFKIAIALAMLLVLFMPYLMHALGFPALILLSILMLGAISMHIKVRDPFVRAVPAILMLTMALTIILMVRTF